MEEELRYEEAMKRMEAAQAADAEIAAMKNLLEQTDHEILKAFEAVMSAEGITEFLTALRGMYTKISGIVDNRKAWREKIKELEASKEGVA